MRSMTDSEPPRPWLPNPLFIGTTMIVLAMAVLLTVGAHAAALGDDPAWAWDCNDTTCEDLWARPRAHYRRVAVSCALALPVGWAIAGRGLPSSPLSPPERPAPPVAWIVALSSPVVAMIVGAVLGFFGSRPWGLAGAAGVMLLASLSAWRDLESRGWPRRGAWYFAGGEAVLAALIALATAAIGLAFSALWAVPTGAITGGAAFAMVHLLLSRRRPVIPSNIAPRPTSSPWRPPHRRAVDVLRVVILLGTAVWAAWPVPAPPADAWKFGAPTDSRETSYPRETSSDLSTPHQFATCRCIPPNPSG